MAKPIWTFIPSSIIQQQKRDEEGKALVDSWRKVLGQDLADAHRQDFLASVPQDPPMAPSQGVPDGPFSDPYQDAQQGPASSIGGPGAGSDPSAGTAPMDGPPVQAEQGYGGTPIVDQQPSPLAPKATGGYASDAVVDESPMGLAPGIAPKDFGDALKQAIDQGQGQTPDVPPLPFGSMGPGKPLPYIPDKPTQPPQDTTDKIVNDQPLDAQDFASSLTKASMNQGTSPAFQEGMPGVHVGTDTEQMVKADLGRGGLDSAGGMGSIDGASRAVGSGGGAAGGGSVLGSTAIDKTNKMFDEAASHKSIPAGRRWDALTATITRKLTDAGVDLSRLEQDAERVMGRPLNADEKASVLSRLNPFYTAKVAVDEGVRPAVQGLSDEDYQSVRNILAWKGNVDVSTAVGNKVEQNALKEVEKPALRDIGPQNAPMIAVGGESPPAGRKSVTVDKPTAAEASVLGQEAAINRKFSGGLDAAESQAALDEIQRKLGPEKYADLEGRAQQIVDFNRTELQKDVDAGLVKPEQAQQWLQDYPNYTPVVISDYLKEQGRAVGGGRSLGVSANGVKALTVEGTDRARLDPIAASVDAAYQGEALRRRNAAFNALYDLTQKVPELQQMFQVEKGGYTGATKYEKSVTGFVNGEKYTLTTPFEDMARVLKQEGEAAIPGIGPAMQLYKELITGKNPTFLVGNAAIDAPIAILRQAAREGGAQNVPGVLVDLFKGYADAFKGILTGEYKGSATRDYLAQGGGMGSYYAPTAQSGTKEVERLRRGSLLNVSSPADVKRVITDVLKLEPVKGLGERVELGPRAMAYKRTLEKGASPTDAVMAGRTVTVDFAQGGSFAKLMNQVVPFLNPAIQGGAQVVREARAHPKGTLLTLGPALVGPALAIEAWNNADPDRAAAYADVPDYVKDRGLVVMLPGKPPTDEKGEPRPQYAMVNLRELAPIVMMVREGFNRVVGNDHRTAASLLNGAAQQTSPIQSYSQAILPGVKTAAELNANRDLYRKADIASDRNDQQASALSQGIAGGVNRASMALGGNPDVARPSQVDYAIRDLTGGVGEMARGASDIIVGRTKDSGTPQDIPGAGGFIRRVVRGDNGQQLQTARDERLATPIRQALYEAGLKPDVAVVGSTIGKIPLSKGEQTVYQRAMNGYVNQMLGEVVKDADFKAAPPDIKQKIVQNILDGARKSAGAEALARVNDTDLERRLSKKAS